MIARALTRIARVFIRLINFVFGYTEQLFSPNLTPEQLDYLHTVRKVDLHTRRNGFNALHRVALSPLIVGKHNFQREKLTYLLEQGVDPNAQTAADIYCNTPLHLMIANENTGAALFFIQECERLRIPLDFMRRDTFGCTPLLLASKLRQSEVALAILGKISFLAGWNAQDNTGMTALHYAAVLGQRKLYLALLEAGADPSITNNHGETASHVLEYSEAQISELLNRVEIHPDRDEKALRNNVLDQNLQTLLMVQSIEGKILCLPLRIPSQKTNIAAVKQMLAQGCIIDTSTLGLEKKLRAVSEAGKQFILDQCAAFTGTSILQACFREKKSLKKDLLNKPQHRAVAALRGDQIAPKTAPVLRFTPRVPQRPTVGTVLTPVAPIPKLL